MKNNNQIKVIILGLLSKLNFSNGQIFPKKEILEAGEVAQLVCDVGYQPISIPHIKCDFNVYKKKYQLNHAKLDCVRCRFKTKNVFYEQNLVKIWLFCCSCLWRY